MSRIAPETHPRSRYARIYVPVSREGYLCIVEHDGKACAFIDYDLAEKKATEYGYIVISLHWFINRVLANMEPRPHALRIFGHGGRKYHAEFDASQEEFATLNQVLPSDFIHDPTEAKELLKGRVLQERT